MTGVEILSQTNIYEIKSYPWIVAIGIGIGMLIGLKFAIEEWNDFGFSRELFLFFALFTLIGLAVGGFGFLISRHETDTVDYIEYKVAVSDEVNFTDFMDKYEILDQEGKIYTVKERE